MLRLSHLTLARGARRLLVDADLTVHDRHKVGLVGANGSGKSSLFAAIRGELLADAGEIDVPAAWTLAHVAQETAPTSTPAIEYVLDGDAPYRVAQNRSLQKITTGSIEDGLDGIEPVSENEFLVSVWQGAVHFVNGDGTHELLLDTRADQINAADIGYDRTNRIVYVPTFFKNSVVAYELKRAKSN